MRTYRRALGLSQSAFAAQLNVPLETYRPWDAGRREPPPQLLTRARTLAGYPDETVLLPLPVLALMIGVHVRTLHAAARSGRLGVAYDTRTTFRRLRPRATLKHALDFRRHYYGTQRRPPATPVPLTWASVPEDYDVQLKALRRHLDISQAGFARLVGAARKAVVYQWEARKRCPSPVFWARIQAISTGVASERETSRRHTGLSACVDENSNANVMGGLLTGRGREIWRGRGSVGRYGLRLSGQTLLPLVS